MRYIAWIFLALITTAWAADVSPSRDTMPQSTTTQDQRFSIFAGDPARIQKANSIDPKDFLTTLTVTPNQLSATGNKAQAGPLHIAFAMKNKGIQTVTFSYPTTQRYDFTLTNPAGKIVYLWSNDKKFLTEVGTLIVNPIDKITYSDTVPLDALYEPLQPGTYTVEAHVANTPEVKAKTTFTVSP